MGLVTSVVEATEADEASDSDSDDQSRPYSPNDGHTDPFLNGYDTENVRLDDQTADRLLGMAVVISNLFT